ncbi:unnamed protein product [Arabidopsis lyrata]|nr:unnamed protein product [Arabidopsis lyrata]
MAAVDVAAGAAAGIQSPKLNHRKSRSSRCPDEVGGGLAYS